MELRQYALLLWRWAWLIVLATVLAAGAAFISSKLQTPVYEASTQLLIDEAPDSEVSDYTAILTSERLARTYAQMMAGRPVLEETIARVGVNLDPDDLSDAVQVQLVRDTQLIEVKVESTSRTDAANLANTLVVVFTEQNDALQAGRFEASKASLSSQLASLQEQIDGIETELVDLGEPRTDADETKEARLQAELTQYRASYTTLLQSYEELRLEEARSVSNVVQIVPAAVPESPVRPRTMMNTALAAVVGAMLAVGAVFLIEYLDDTVKSKDEVEMLLHLPVLGFIARQKDKSDGELYVKNQPRAPIAEAFRTLRSNIQFAGVDKPIRTLLITSAGPDEGKSTVSANLALTIAQGGRKVALLEADLRKPRVHKILDVPAEPGLSTLFLEQPGDLGGVVRHWNGEELDFIASGKLPPNPAELLASERMERILAGLATSYDMVVVDSPPAGVVTDAAVLAGRVDGVLLVVEPKQTKLGAAMQTVEQLRRAGANLIGVVFNNVPLRRAGYYGGQYNGYYYQYAYDYGDDDTGNR